MDAAKKPTEDEWCFVVVPCYNEEARLRGSEFLDFLAQGHLVRFLFVNDGSRDGTLRMLNELRERAPEQIFVLDRQPNAGKAEAVRAGMLDAMSRDSVSYVGFWDADLATPLDAILEMLAQFKANDRLEMVFGARVALLGRAIQRQPMRHYAGRGFATLASLMLRLPIYDTQCGAKIFRNTTVLREMLAEPFQSRWIFDVELLARYLVLKGRDLRVVEGAIYELPLREWRDVQGSKVHLGDYLRAVGELLMIRSRYSL